LASFFPHLRLPAGQAQEIDIGWIVHEVPERFLRAVGCLKLAAHHVDGALQIKAGHRHGYDTPQAKRPIGSQRGNEGNVLQVLRGMVSIPSDWPRRREGTGPKT